MKTSLIISTYNWPQALNLCLKSVMNQTVMPDEIVIADDGSKEETKQLIDSYRAKINVPIIHVWQEDEGFQLSKIRNKAIAKSTGDYIIQIDGDLILHKKFITDHKYVAEKGCFIRGTRSTMEEKKSETILKSGNINLKFYSCGLKNRLNSIRIPLLMRKFAPKRKNAIRMKGCNMAFWKSDFLEVNGYNNDLNGWGHEDEELACRFINLGLLKKIVKLRCIAFHIYHPLATKKVETIHQEMIEKVIRNKIVKTSNGIKQVENSIIYFK